MSLFITLQHIPLVILMILFVFRKNRIRPDPIHCEFSFVLVQMLVKLLLHIRMKPCKLIICDMKSIRGAISPIVPVQHVMILTNM